MTLTRRTLLTATATAVPLGIAGCGRHSTATGKPVDKVGYLTALGDFGREGYARVAAANGYFAEVGIQVTVHPGAAGDSNLRLLAAGQAQFAAIDFTGAAVRAGTVGPDGTTPFDEFRCVAGLQQQTMMSIIVPAGSRIHAAIDLAGKTIGVQQGSVLQTMFPAFARLSALDARSVRWRPVESSTLLLPLLAAGTIDAVALFAPGAPGVEAAIHGPVTVLPYSNVLADLYGNALVTTYAMVQNNPGLVRRFTAALLKGLLWSVDNPDAAGRIVHRAVPATNADTAAAELRLVKPYVGQPVGGLDPARVARTIATLQSLGLIKSGYDPAKLVTFPLVPSTAPTGA